MPAEMTAVDTKRELDLVVVGAGGGGLVTAIRASDLGLRVAIVEVLDRVGGATAFSGGQVWVGNNHLMRERGLSDSTEDVSRYVHGIADDRDLIDEPVAEQWIEAAPEAAEYLERASAIVWDIIPGYPDYYHPGVPGSKGAGRYLTAAPLNGAELGAARELLLTTPHFPLGATYAELFEMRSSKTRMADLVAQRAVDDVLTFGTAIIAYLFRAALARRIPLLLEHRAVELILDDGVVTGVVCETPAEPVALFGDVVLATSTYDWDPELVEEFSWLKPEESGSVAPPGLRGDAIRLARQAGANILALPADAAPHVPGYRTSIRGPYDNGYRGSAELTLPHCFLVNRAGRRFADDSFYWTVTSAVLGDSTRSNYPFFLIWDEQHHEKYGLRPVAPGEPYPAELNVKSAPTIGELAVELGVDADNLVETTARFNANARLGVDPDFHRGEADFLKMFRGDHAHEPNPVLGPVERAPFYGMQMLLLGTAIGAAGVHAGLSGQALGPHGRPIAGLYAVGSAAALTTSGTGYNSGFSLSRAMTFGYLAAGHVADRSLGRSTS